MGKTVSSYSGIMYRWDGEAIFIPFWLFKKLKSISKNYRIIRYDKKTLRWHILPSIKSLFPILNLPDHNPHKALRAVPIEPGIINKRKYGHKSIITKALGTDCSGLSSPDPVTMRMLQSDLDRTETPEYAKLNSEEIVSDIKSKRNKNASINSR